MYIKTMRRDDWRRVLEKTYQAEDFQCGKRNGKLSLLKIRKVTAPLQVDNGPGPFTIANQDYAWVQLAFAGEFAWFTAMFDDVGNLLQVYVDMTNGNHTDADDPWFEDMYLDYALADGRVFELDRDELDAALAQAQITRAQYDRTLAEGEKIRLLLTRHASEIQRFFTEKYNRLTASI